jgi:hypothetical protein
VCRQRSPVDFAARLADTWLGVSMLAHDPMPSPTQSAEPQEPEGTPPRPVCPICGGELIEIRAKLQCQRCHTILETCCEGGRQ